MAGISDIQIYLPKKQIFLEDIISYRRREDFELADRMEKAKEKTAQESIRFPSSYEDIVSMALNSCYKILQDKKIGNLKQLLFATETTVDFSKPMSSYILGNLKKQGINLNKNILSYQIQNACVSGLIGMINGLDNIKKDEKILLITSDIAMYEPCTTAELTQGAGSVSMLLEEKGKIIDFDTDHIGYYFSNEDDFFKPIERKYPSVKGKYSIEKYYQAIKNALFDYCHKANVSIKELFNNVDYFIFHLPFSNIANIMAEKLEDELKIKIKKDKIKGLEISTYTGNIYTGSIFLSFLSLLFEKKQSEDLSGKTIAFFGYGSGSSSVFIEGKVSKDYKNALSNIHNDKFEKVLVKDYLNWTKDYIIKDDLDDYKGFYLKNIEENGFREYDKI